MMHFKALRSRYSQRGTDKYRTGWRLLEFDISGVCISYISGVLQAFPVHFAVLNTVKGKVVPMLN
jgi:hypothetical protein